jgi:hypothetical protein
MSKKLPPALLQSTDIRLVIEAIYYVVRVLRNAMRGYQDTLVSTEASPEAHELARRAINEIEMHEQSSIDCLNNEVLGEYIEALEELGRVTHTQAIGKDTDRANSILEEMRLSKE